MNGKKITVAEWIEYVGDTNVWPEGRFVEESVIKIDGEQLPEELDFDVDYFRRLRADAEVTISSGYIRDENDRATCIDLAKDFNAWRVKQTVETVVVTVGKGYAASCLRHLLRNNGYTFA